MVIQRKAALAMLAVALLAGTAAGTSGAAKTPKLVTVTISDSPSLLYTPVFVASAEGFLAKAGIKADFVTLTASAAVQAILSGDVQIGLNAEDSSMIPAGLGKPTPAMVVLQQHNTVEMLVQPKYAAATKLAYPLNVRALPKGFTIATTTRSGGIETYMDALFAGAGLKEGTDYTVVVVGDGPGLVAAMQSGRVDAEMSFPAWNYISKSAAGGGMLSMMSEAKGQGPAAVVAGHGTVAYAAQTWISQHHALAKQFVAAVVKAEQWMHNPANYQKLLQIAAAATGVSVAIANEAMPGIINLSSPQFSCTRLAAEVRENVAEGAMSELPACVDLRNPTLGPLPTIPALKKKP